MIKLSNILKELELDPGSLGCMVLYLESSSRGNLSHGEIHSIHDESVKKVSMKVFRRLIYREYETMLDRLLEDEDLTVDEAEYEATRYVIDYSFLCYSPSKNIAQVTVGDDSWFTHLVIPSNHHRYEELSDNPTDNDIQTIASDIISNLGGGFECEGVPSDMLTR